jgi:hypothetical protein
VNRILKSTKPAELPVEQPMTFDFVVNLQTARELGITLPEQIMLQVTDVIQEVPCSVTTVLHIILSDSMGIIGHFRSSAFFGTAPRLARQDATSLRLKGQ